MKISGQSGSATVMTKSDVVIRCNCETATNVNYV